MKSFALIFCFLLCYSFPRLLFWNLQHNFLEINRLEIVPLLKSKVSLGGLYPQKTRKL